MSQPSEPFRVKPFGNMASPHGFYQLLQQHVDWLALHNFSDCTIEKRALYVRAFGLWCLERDIVTPLSITKPMLEAFQRHLYRHRQVNGKPLAWSSQHLHLKEIRQFFSWLAKQNFIPFNPAADLELPKVPRQLPKAVLSIDEVERILQQPDVTTPLGLRDRAIFEVLYSTGMRRQEVCRLRLDHIYVDRQVLFVSLEEGAEGSLCTDRLARLNMDRALHAASTAPVLARFNRADIIFNGGWHTHSSRFVDRIWTAILKGGWG